MTRRIMQVSIVALLLVLALTALSYGPTGATTAPLATPCSIPSFGQATTVAVGNARSLAVADFNGDNKPDLVVPNNSVSSNVRILLGNGTGGFTSNGNFTVGRNPVSVAVADFNNDGKTDVITANDSSFNGGEASVILGNGAGSFGSPTHIRWSSPGVTTRSNSVAVADFNSDGKTDVAVTNFFAGSRVLTALGDGTGQFTNLQTIITGSSPTQILAVDLSSDNKPDLAFVNSNSNTVSVLIGDGTGQFASATNFVVGTGPLSLTKGDFNGDGKVDLATANFGTNDVSVLLNDGTGFFGFPTPYFSGGESTSAITSGDFDADGLLDLAVLNRDPKSVVILRNEGAGVFKSIASFLHGGADPQFIAVGEFNGDERTDLAVAHELLQRVSVLLNNCETPSAPTLRLADSTFFLSEFITDAHVTVARVGSLEGTASVQFTTVDGSAVSPSDYIVLSGTLVFPDGVASRTIPIFVESDIFDEPDESFQVVLSNATGSAALASPSSAPVFIFDDDPAPQISISDAFTPEGNSGTTTASLAVTLSAPSGFTVTVNYATADGAAVSATDYLSANGTLTFLPGESTKKIDVSVVGETLSEIDESFFVNLSNPSNATLASAQGAGMILDDDSACPAPKFQLSSNLSVNTPIDLATADFNGDNKKDLIIANRSANSVVLFLSDGIGGFSVPSSFSVGMNPQSIETGDFNGDLKLDVVTVNEFNMSILLGNGSGGFAPAITTTVPNPRWVSVGDVNTDGKLDLAIVGTAVGGNGSVAILLGDGSGGFGTPTSYATGQSSLFGTLAHLNSDNKLDIVVANLNSFDLSILINNGDGTFAAAVSIPLGFNVHSVVAGDVNGDNKVDLVALGSTQQGKVSVLLGNGDGSFSSPVTSTVSPAPFRGSLVDLNNDGRLDLATANPNGSDIGSVLVQFGNGAGSFSSPTNYLVGHSPLAVGIADFNSDTRPDLAIPNLNSAQVSILLNTCASVPLTTFQFNSSAYLAFEGNPSVSITVTRNGDTSGTSSVDYTTTDTDNFTVNCSHLAGNAFARCDFATSVDTLTFAPGETSKTFEIPIINDAYAEGPETFGLALSNVTGATLGSPSTATITVNDSEAVDGFNPIFTTPFFVRQHYLDFLSREPEIGEPWTALLNNCPNLSNNPACDRLTVSGAFFGSPEFQLKGYFVYRFTKLAFDRLPLYTEIVADMRAVTGATPTEVFQKKAAFTNNFVLQTEFTNLYNAQTNAQYVNTLMGRYSLTQITTPDPAAPDGTNKVTLTSSDLVNALNGATLTRAQVLRAIADSDQIFQLEFNPAFVAMQYYGYLRRTPEPAGFNAWLTFLNANPGSSRTMVNGFMNSAEYWLRFGPLPFGIQLFTQRDSLK